MLNNLEHVLPLLSFESEDDFYHVQILARKKDNPAQQKSVIRVKSYYVKSEEYLLERFSQMQVLADSFNARVMITLNRKSFEQTAKRALVNLAELISQDQYATAGRAYEKAAGQTNGKSEAFWLLDIDRDEKGLDGSSRLMQKVQRVIAAVDESAPTPHDSKRRVVAAIPSASGYHVITRGFDPREFKEQFPDVEIKKNNPTNLYIPNA